MKRLVVAATLCVASVGYAGYGGGVSNQKAHCVILKNDKVVHQQNCLYDGEMMGNIWSLSYSTRIKKIKGYGNFNIEYFSKSLEANDNVVYDSDGQIVTAEEWLTLNGKPAQHRYRMSKTFKEFTQTQATRYEQGKLNIAPYNCYYLSSGKGVEICYK